MPFTISTLVFAHAALLLTSIPQSFAATCPTLSEVKKDLGSKLSQGSSISASDADAPRWSLYRAPNPAFVVNVSSENDVAPVVCLSRLQCSHQVVSTKQTGSVLQQKEHKLPCSKPG